MKPDCNEEHQALEEIEGIVEDAMRPDSGARVGELLGRISEPLSKVGMDPMGDIDCQGDEAGDPVCERADTPRH